MKGSRAELVAEARHRLSGYFAITDDARLSADDQETAIICERLGDLAVQFDEAGQPGVVGSLLEAELGDAWRAGLAPDGYRPAPVHAYVAMIEELVISSATSPAAWCALCLHAGERISDSHALPVVLRRFVVDHLTGHITAPRRRGAPRKVPLDHLPILATMEHMMEQHGLPAVGGGAGADDNSACGIVADAMRELRRQPFSRSRITDLWFGARQKGDDAGN